jgi:hypothetical protein
MAAMIPVQLPQEPDHYRELVRNEGLAFFQEMSLNPEYVYNRAIFNTRRTMADGRIRSCEYWQLAKDALRNGHCNRCVYTCFLIEEEFVADASSTERIKVGGHSIDHFRPIAASPARLDYEWTNFRWAWRYIDNNFKANHVIPDEHDPVNISAGAIQMKFDNNGDLLAMPNPALPDEERLTLDDTIKKLGLNDAQVKKFRRDCFDDFINPESGYSEQQMKEIQPFIYQYMTAS